MKVYYPNVFSNQLSDPNVPSPESGFYANGPETPTRLVFRRSKSQTVLFVDDDAGDIYLLDRAIEEQGDGVRLVAFRNPGEALQVCIHSKVAPDVVVLDINMPGISGFELLDRLKSLPLFRKVPFVILTTSDYDYFRKRADVLGADLFLVKPPTYVGYPEAAKSILSLVDPTRND